MTTDPIADLLTRIRNAYNAQKDNVRVPHSKTKMAVLKVMQDRKFIHSFAESGTGTKKDIEVTLSNNINDITLKRVSKPGQRIYVKSGNISKINGGLGVAILSTSKGIMSGEEAQKNKSGGEVICEIY